jgi:hypothetical protein
MECCGRLIIKEKSWMPGLNTSNPNDFRVAMGKLSDGWTYDIERIPKSERFRATVVHPYGSAASGGVPWPVEDPGADVDPTYPTYTTIEEAVLAATRYVEALSHLPGYPDPDKMSARGFRPTLW